MEFMQIRHSPGAPLVLKGITCTFQGGQQVGIVGRVGSGKVSIYFRASEEYRKSYV